jgi:hypothetical protein
MSTTIRDLEGFLGEISDAVGSSRYYDDIELSVEGIERIIMAADPAEQGRRLVALFGRRDQRRQDWFLRVPARVVRL